MSAHPIGPRLEALAASERDVEAEAHVATCEACAAYVAKLRAGAEKFAASDDAETFLRAVESRAARPVDEAANVVRPLVWARMAWIVAPLAAAAIFLLVVRPPAHVTDDTQTARPSSSLSSVHFKGGTQLAAIIERDGHQERTTGEVRARPGDRLRIEVSLDEEGPLVAGILEKDGTWTPLLPATLLEAGTHYSNEAARLDEAGADGWILAGRPDAIERARQTRDFSGLAVLPLVPMR